HHLAPRRTEATLRARRTPSRRRSGRRCAGAGRALARRRRTAFERLVVRLALEERSALAWREVRKPKHGGRLRTEAILHVHPGHAVAVNPDCAVMRQRDAFE